MVMSAAAALGHIDPLYRRHAALSDRERIQWIQADRWIGFDQAQAALDRLYALLAYPARDRMPCLLIYGDTGMGKTKIVRKFERMHPPTFCQATGVTRRPVVVAQIPPEPVERDLYRELLASVVTLIALDALFGIARYGLCEPSSAAADLLRRAVLPQSRDGPRRRVSVPSPPRPFAEYLRLAREILLDPEWTTAAGASPRRQEQILSRLMAAKLAASPPPGSARVSPPMKREASPPLKRENPTPGSDFSGLSAQ
jgi:hypothetical protein